MSRAGGTLRIGLSLLIFVALLVSSAGAERVQRGNLIVSLNGGISPRSLPRHERAPVSVHLAGDALTADRAPLPRVNWIRLELAWRGVLNTRGLAICPKSRLISATTRQAVRRCAAAKVGEGSLFAKVFLPTQIPFRLNARITAFNGRTRSGRHAVLIHANSLRPPISFTIPFSVHHHAGAFRTVLVALIRRSAGPWPHVVHFSVDVSRSFRFRGHKRSYLAASCPIPTGFTAAFLSLARATYSFQGGRKVTTATVRSCRARP